MAKRRYQQKNEEKNNAIRMRASEFKEKEKVRVILRIYYYCTPAQAQLTGYYGYVPTVGKAAVRITITP
jgi:hypothetical protein